uniref:Uncharacterized protein n=1 Tax=Setaria italica TaxID=4555 RepID=K3ZYT2_SETIT
MTRLPLRSCFKRSMIKSSPMCLMLSYQLNGRSKECSETKQEKGSDQRKGDLIELEACHSVIMNELAGR